MKIIAERLKHLMEMTGVTQAELSRILDCGESVIYYWLKQKTTPNAMYIIKICDYFNVCADYLLGRQDIY